MSRFQTRHVTAPRKMQPGNGKSGGGFDSGAMLSMMEGIMGGGGTDPVLAALEGKMSNHPDANVQKMFAKVKQKIAQDAAAARNAPPQPTTPHGVATAEVANIMAAAMAKAAAAEQRAATAEANAAALLKAQQATHAHVDALTAKLNEVTTSLATLTAKLAPLLGGD